MADDDELHTLPSRVHALMLVSRPGDPDAAENARGPLSWPDPAADLLRQGPGRRAPADRDHGVHPRVRRDALWQQLLHNQSALRFKARLLFAPGVVVVSVPYQFGVAEDSWIERTRPSRVRQCSCSGRQDFVKICSALFVGF
ncbi:MAG TPA: hypothetical protein VES60_01830 [Nakamurella sp.]|nr:hypothetical protein [Nakamurella sp.]